MAMTDTQPATVLVTGASSGFGEAITRRFAATGARVVATARRSDRLKDLGLNPAQDADLDNWEQMIDTNCKGLAYCTRAVLPGMVARRRGHVINLGSVAGTYPYPGGNAYGGTKAFVHQFSLNLRSDLHGTGVRVTCIEPGMADTEFSTVRFSGDKARAGAVYAGMQPLTADDIAGSVYWAATLPPHVNVNVIELMPVAQSFAPFQIARDA
jgi:3-hydroxy acid dehydrogenase/malonic semialdehyde reductase